MVNGAGLEPESSHNTSGTNSRQKAHTILPFIGDHKDDSSTSGSSPTLSENTSRHTECAISVQQGEVLEAFEGVPKALKETILNWGDLPSERKERIVQFLEEEV
jgi:hypothetical protein